MRTLGRGPCPAPQHPRLGAPGSPRWRPLLATAVALALVAPACQKKSDATSSGSAEVIGPTGAKVRVGESGFTPASLVVAKGAPGATAPLTFVRTTNETCAKEVVFPDLGVKKDLPLDTPVTVQVPTDTARTLAFQCGMAMYKGALVVR